GRASTYVDGDGEWVEQGLHLFIGYYTELKQLLREIQQPPDDVLFWMTQVQMRDPDGAAATFGINPILAPVKTLGTVLGNNDYLGALSKIGMVPLAAPGVRGYEHIRKAHDHETVYDWWKRSGASTQVLERFLRPFCRGIQFTEPEQFSAFNFLTWIHHTATHLPTTLLGGYRGPRDVTFFQPLAAWLQARGAKIRTGVRLVGIDHAPGTGTLGRITGFRLSDGTRLEGDAFVAALPVWALTPLVPPALRAHPFFAGLSTLPIAPAISVQLWFDGRVTDTDDFFLVAKSEACVFQDQSTNAYPYAGGSRLSVIVSPADPLLNVDDAAIVARVLERLGKVEPRIQARRVLKSVVLKHTHHLVRPLPGAMSRRPTQVTPVPNLFFAGDWTEQPFFGSQEGAVRGGKRCARAIVEAFAEALV
ncbi:MAG: FAD-dependent oxidoreductase, partial [Myxococcota bacterium]